MKRTIITTREPDGIRIQNAFGNSVFIPEEEINGTIADLVRLN